MIAASLFLFSNFTASIPLEPWNIGKLFEALEFLHVLHPSVPDGLRDETCQPRIADSDPTPWSHTLVTFVNFSGHNA